MPELLLELLSEEIPARMQKRAGEDLQRLVCDGLKKAGLTFDSAAAYATPRRLTLVVTGLPDKQPDVKDERKGPQVGAPEQAINGFLGSLGGLTLDDCVQRDVKGKTFWFAVIDKKGQLTTKILEQIITNALIAFNWPKSMRWRNSIYRWVRPLHSILAVFDDSLVKLGFPIGQTTDSLVYETTHGIEHERDKNFIYFSKTTVGHRFLSPEPFVVTNFDDYKTKLMANKVMLDAADRREKIRVGADALAKAAGLSVKADDALLDEVAGLVEWPVTLIGSIDNDFMDVPPEVLIAAMRGHQKYFSLLDADGKLAAKFIFVSNMETADNGAAIIAGNERVLRARLSDTKFFWDQDRKIPLADRLDSLNDIIFHAKLGTVRERVSRMESLIDDVAPSIDGLDKGKAKQAVNLAKCDLVTGMVGELPELQGLMGRYYALENNVNVAVADAIAEHYSPAGPNDACPSNPVSVAVALAEKIDTLAGFWLMDEKPTGSKDPFALRRAALGAIRLILENKLSLQLLLLFPGAVQLHRNQRSFPMAQEEIEKLPSSLLAFFADRLKVHLKEKGVRHDLIDAVFALGEDDLVRVLARVDALGAFLGTDDGANLLVAYKRAANIVRIEEKKDEGVEYREVKRELFEEDEEDTLWQNLNAVQDSFEVSLKENLFMESMAGLAQLRPPIDAFFDKVTVNSDKPELRANRLALLRAIVVVMNQVADFSKIEG